MTVLRASRRLRQGRLLALAVTSVVLLALEGAAPALATEIEVPHWNIESRVAPTNLPPEGEGVIVVTATNLGDAEANGGGGHTVKIIDTLPKGVVATGARESLNLISENAVKAPRQAAFKCPVKTGAVIECTYTGTLPPYELLQVKVNVTVSKEASSGSDNAVTVEGGGAEKESLNQPITVSSAPTPFGVETYKMQPENEEFKPDEAAGSHPFQLTSTFDLNQAYELEFGLKSDGFFPSAPALTRNLAFKLPAGMIGDVNAVPTCSDASFGAQGEGNTNACKNDTAVGVASVEINNPGQVGNYVTTWVVPVFNLAPAPGEPARFGFTVAHVPVVLDTAVRTGEDYGVTVSVHNASQAVEVLGSKVTFWGIPGDKRHDISRGQACFFWGSTEYKTVEEPCNKTLKEPSPPPFLTLPTTCQSLNSPVSGVAWNGDPLTGAGETEGLIPNESPTTLGECLGLPFSPSIEVTPESKEASTPAGLAVKVSVPQESTLESSYAGKAEADVSSTKLELPVGIQTSAGAANGLLTCSVEEAGFDGANTDTGATLQGELGAQMFTPAAASCPEAAKIGSVDIRSPDLKEDLIGGVYLAQQDTNPFASPLVLYIIAEEKTSKVLVKLAGEVQINPANGQLTSDFRNTPQDPFETLTLHLWNGPRASQATPAFCGNYNSKATFTTSSNPETTVTQEPRFEITSGPGGTPCPGATLPFKPGFEAGSTNPQGGEYSPFTLTINKPDGQQQLQSITAQLPPGLAAKIAAVTPCAATAAIEALPMPDPNPPPCGPESLIGHTTTESGLGSEPFVLQGSLYLTKGVDGAPFGLLASTKAEAGPFDLGWVNILSTITVNEETAAVTTKTITPIPQILDGVPVQLKAINVTVERPGNAPFQFNPTNCSAASVTGSLGAWEGGSEALSYPFDTSNCASLGFKPDFKAYTEGHTSKEGGASLRVRINYPPGAYANIAKSVTFLPYDLPSRLKPTIQHACPDYDFNPNALQQCDPLSLVGHAIVHTPVFKNPLEGPAYLVSHANRSFPDVDIILTEPESGVKIVLDGHTDIKNGITKTSFENVPDAPVETFELILPEGPHSALAANGNLCDETKTTTTTKHVTRKVKGKTEHVTVKVKTTVPEKLVLPTTLTAQNGAVIEQPTPIVVEGCPKAAVKSSKTTKKPAKKPKKKKK